MEYDVVVVGAGTGGSLASKTASELGLKVCLLDHKKYSKVGEKICGDAIEENDLNDLGIAHPRGEELANIFYKVIFHPPDINIRILVKNKGYIINRLAFGQRLLKEALDVGVIFYEESMVLSPIISKGSVIGVEYKDMKTRKKKTIRGKIIIDASGFYSPLRKFLKSLYVDSEISKNDIWVCYREIIKMKEMNFNPSINHVYLLEGSGVYSWFFPKSKISANLGVCILGSSAKNVKKCYKNYYRTIISPRIQKPIKIIHQGGGVIPVRHPLWSLVENGIMFVGDAGCQVNPIYGAGIGSSMRAGIYAGTVAMEAIEQDDCSIDELWKYNKWYAEDQGGAFASLDLLRIFLQRLSKKDLNFLFQNKIISGDDMLDFIRGKMIQSKFSERLSRGSTRLDLLMSLKFIYNQMKEMRNLYQKYPVRSNFKSWQNAINKIYEKVNQLIP